MVQFESGLKYHNAGIYKKGLNSLQVIIVANNPRFMNFILLESI